MHKQSGFSLMEVMTVIAILGILSALAYPSFESTISLNKVQSQTTRIMNALMMARSEAIKTGQRTVICKSANKTTCATGGFWEQGWIIFVSPNGNDMLDAGDTIISVSTPVPDKISIRGGALNLSTIAYRPDGTTGLLVANPQDLSFKVCFKFNMQNSRQVYINATGRPGVDTNGVFGSCLTI